MKKSIAVILISLCLITGTIFYRVKLLSDTVHPSEFLPENVLVYLNHKDLEGILNTFRDTSLAKVIDSIDFVKIALDIEAPLSTVEKIQTGRDILSSPEALLVFEELLGEDFSLALLSTSDITDSYGFFKKNSVFFSKPKHGVTPVKLLRSVFSKKFTISNIPYGKYLIHRVEVNKELTVSFVSASPLIIVTFDERTLRQCIDRFDAKKANLNNNISFEKLQKKYEDAQLFCFFSIERMQKQLQKFFENTSTTRNRQFSHPENWNGFTSGAYGVWQKEMFIEDVVTIFFDKDKLNKHTSSFLSITAEEDKRLYQVPNDVLLYYWTNTFNFPVLWNIYANRVNASGENIQALESFFYNLTGYPINEIISLPGNRFSLMIKEPAPVDFLPIPNFVAIFDINSTEAATKMSDNILKRNKVPHQSQIYKGIKYIYWGEQIQSGLQPAYAFNKKSLYVASSVRTLKNVFDTMIDKNGLITNEQFKLTGESLLLKNNSIGYIQSSSTLDVTKELVSWFGTMLAIQNRQIASKSKIVIDGVIHPLLEGLKMYSSIATRSYIEEGVITIESKTTITH